jgi:hypothetical protein
MILGPSELRHHVAQRQSVRHDLEIINWYERVDLLIGSESKALEAAYKRLAEMLFSEWDPSTPLLFLRQDETRLISLARLLLAYRGMDWLSSLATPIAEVFHEHHAPLATSVLIGDVEVRWCEEKRSRTETNQSLAQLQRIWGQLERSHRDQRRDRDSTRLTLIAGPMKEVERAISQDGDSRMLFDALGCGTIALAAQDARIAVATNNRVSPRFSAMVAWETLLGTNGSWNVRAQGGHALYFGARVRAEAFLRSRPDRWERWFPNETITHAVQVIGD